MSGWVGVELRASASGGCGIAMLSQVCVRNLKHFVYIVFFTGKQEMTQ